MNINQVIGMLHGMQEPMESGRYHDIIIVITSSSSIHHDVIFCHHQDGGFIKTIGKKKRPDFAINLHIFLVWFFKSH